MGGDNLVDAIEAVCDSMISKIHTCLPGRIEKYDHTKRQADVKPLIKKHYLNGQVYVLPVIPAVPVVFPCTNNSSLTFPINKGDGVLLLFTERAMEEWLSKGGDCLPGARRKFDLTDAVAIPGLYPFVAPSPQEDNSSLVLKHKGTKVKIGSDGKIAIGANGVEVLDVLFQLIDTLSTSIIVAGVAPGTWTFDPAVLAQFLTLKTSLNQIKGSL